MHADLEIAYYALNAFVCLSFVGCAIFARYICR